MDVIISTSVPYSPVWKKRGSQYLTSDEMSNINDSLIGCNKIYAEKKEVVGRSVPFFCTEDLSCIIVTELDYNQVYYGDDEMEDDNWDSSLPEYEDTHCKPDSVINKVPTNNPIHSPEDHLDDNHTDAEHDCNWEVIGETISYIDKNAHSPEDHLDDNHTDAEHECLWEVIGETTFIQSNYWDIIL